jgi:hypothetical protein
MNKNNKVFNKCLDCGLVSKKAIWLWKNEDGDIIHSDVEINEEGFFDLDKIIYVAGGPDSKNAENIADGDAICPECKSLYYVAADKSEVETYFKKRKKEGN